MNPPVKPQPIVVEGLTPTTYWGSLGVMWWTKKGRKSPKVAAETLEEQLLLLQAEFRTLKTEWLNTYEQLYKLAGRLDAARRWDAGKTPTTPATDQLNVPHNGDEVPPLSPADATPAQAPQNRLALLKSLTG